jgi:predicted RNA binding protein YcfA (HicA-like mRNA interferase family)
MKRVKFLKHLNVQGCSLAKHATRHDEYINHINGNYTYVPRHADIDTRLCMEICKQLDIPKPAGA